MTGLSRTGRLHHGGVSEQVEGKPLRPADALIIGAGVGSVVVLVALLTPVHPPCRLGSVR